MRTRRRSTMLGLLPVVATLALASCDDGSGSGRGPSLLTFAQIAVTPEQLDVRVIAGNVSLGDSETFPLRLRNIGQANLEIRSITLSYAPPAGVEEPAPAFELVLPAGLDLATGPAVVRPSGSAGDDPEELVVEVVFRHHDRVPRSARLLIESNSRENDPLSVVFLSEEGVPVMSVSPDVVDFGSVSAGEELEFALTVFNTGTSDLYFNGFQLFGDPGFSFVDPVRGLIWKMSGETQDGVLFAGPHIIGPARSERFAVRFSPETVEMQEARLILETNDPAPGAGVVVRLLANREVPLVEVRPSSIDFEDVAIGATLARTVHVYSRGSAALEIVGIEPAEDTSRDFTFDLRRIPDFEDNRRPTEDDSIVVPVNDFVEISVLFTPDMESRGDDGEPLPDVGALLLRTNAYQQEITVPLVGVGVISACPIAVADVLEGEEVPPQTSLHLRGAQSMSSCGPIDRFEWTVSQPEGAASVFLPSPTFGNPTFPADVAGTYEFCLHVWDTCGVRSCEADCAEVVVVPDQTLHVELLWSTPGDPDPFDEGPLTGADLDLHLAHPFALIGGEDLDGDGRPDGWFNSTYDCFWANPRPDWGSFDPTVDDDPSLDRDDTDGAGPENVNLDEPEDLAALPPELVERLGGEPAAFRVGVHYWNDNGYGPSFATLRVYVRGVLVYERSDVRLVHHDMWDALTIAWPSGAVDEIRTEADETKITPEYEHPAYVAP